MRTPSSPTTGRPAKSLGSRSEPMTISHGTSSAAAAAWIRADLPMPGLAPQADGNAGAASRPEHGDQGGAGHRPERLAE